MTEEEEIRLSHEKWEREREKPISYTEVMKILGARSICSVFTVRVSYDQYHSFTCKSRIVYVHIVFPYQNVEVYVQM